MDLLEHEDLVEKYKKLQIELETTTQALYECRTNMKAAQSLELEYQEEIRILQSQASVEQQKFDQKVQLLEENNNNLKTTYIECIESLEKQLAKKEEEVEKLKTELTDMVKVKAACEPTPNNITLDEITQLTEENLNLHEHILDLEVSLGESEKQKTALQEVVKQLEEDLENYKETLKSTNEKLQEANVLNQNLKDECLCLKSELDIIKSQPLDNESRGNSLFAEVDDRRLQLQQNMATMKKKYREMKQEHASLLKQISNLRNENSALVAQWNAEISDKRENEETIINSYKNQIKTLNELLEDYKKDLQEKLKLDSNCIPQSMIFLNNLLTMKREEIESLRGKILQRSFNHTSLAYELAQTQKKNWECIRQISQLKSENEALKEKIIEMEMLSPTETQPPELKPSMKKSEYADETKPVEENQQDSNKAVRFAECTVEPQVTDRSKYRKGAKRLTSQPIKFS